MAFQIRAFEGESVLGKSADSVIDVVQKNPVAVTAGLAGAAVAGGTAVALFRRRGKKKRKNRHPRRGTRRRSNKSVRRRRRRTPYTAGKRRDTSTKRIRYTKRGQPYIILRNGRARFIKSHSARLSHKKKGGRY